MKRTTLSILLVILLSLVGGVWYALNSQWGLGITYKLISRSVPGKLNIQSLQGKLTGPIILRGLDYIDDDIKLKLDELELDWSPLALLKGTIRLTTLDANGLEIKLHKTTGPARSVSATSLALPVTIEILDARLNKISILLDNQQPIEIGQILLQAEAHDESVQLTKLVVESAMFDLTTEGRFGLHQTQAIELRTIWMARLPDIPPLQGSGIITGTLAQLKLNQTINQPGIQLTLQGNLREIITQLKWNLSLEIAQFDSRKISPSWPAFSSQGRFTSSGDLDKFSLSGGLTNDLPGQGTLQVDLNVTAMPNVWQLQHINIKHLPTDASLFATGEWHPGPELGNLSLTGKWQNLSFPLTPSQKTRRLSSKTGQFQFNGSIDKYKFNASADLTAHQWPSLQLQIAGNGNHEQLRLTTVAAQTLDGNITGSAFARWIPHLSWEATLHAQNINPAAHWPDWPGRLNAELHAHRKSADTDRLVNSIELKNVTGQLRGYPLESHGLVSWGPNKFTVTDFKLDVGDSKVRISGSRDDTWSMQAELQSPDLNALCPYSRGSLILSANISGARSTPHIIANLSGNNIAFQDYHIGTITSNIDIDLHKDEQFDTLLTATELTKGDQQWQSLTLTAAGRRTNHQLKLLLKQETDLIQLVVNAGLDEQQIWRGEITDTVFEVNKFGKWQQSQATPFSAGIRQASLEPWCLSQPGARICLQGEREQDNWKAELTASNLPLEVFENWLSPHLKLRGNADIHSNLSYFPEQEVTGTLLVNIPDGFRLEVEDKQKTLTFGTAKLQASLDKTGLAATMVLPANELGELSAGLNLPDWNALSGLYASQPVNGYLTASFASLAQLDGFLLDYPSLTGTLHTDLKIAGTVGRPRLTGETSLTQASAEIPALGIRLSEINLRARSETGKQLDYDFRAFSNNSGPLTVTGHTLLQMPKGWPTKLQIRGNNFQLANLPDAKIKITPQLDVEVQGRRIDLNGSVTVPEARFRPRTLPQTSVTPSRDVVIIDEAELPAVQERWKIYSQVRVILGDHVYFDGFGLRGELQGNVLLIDEPGKLTIGQGEISITEGTYKAYGQDAKIRRGRLMFANTVIENPGIDLEAVREVDTVIAGVRVGGTLKQPELTLFSEPAMAESDIISYFLLGRPMETTTNGDEGQQLQKAILAARLAGGELIVDQTGVYSFVDEISFETAETTEQTALVIGKYLSPKLYVRYLTGMVESSNIVEIHYKLSRRLRVKTEAGYRGSSSVTGADIYYTIEY